MKQTVQTGLKAVIHYTRGDGMTGFSLFDSVHVKWIVVIVFFCTFITFLYKKIPNNKQRNLQLLLFLSLLLLEIVKQLLLVVTDHYTYWSPPLHLCGLGIFVIGWHYYWPNRTTATILYSLTLPGATIALLFPGWTADPVGSFLHIHSFLFHALLVTFVVMLLVAGQLDLRGRDLWRSALFLLVTVPFIYGYNAHFATNFMFLNHPVNGTPLQWLYDLFGEAGYLASFCGLVAVLWVILYSTLFLVKKRRKDLPRIG